MLGALLIIGALTGTCYAQGSGLYADCEGEQSIIQWCGDTHLAYLRKLGAGAQVHFMQRVSEIDDPSFLLEHLQLSMLCNQTGHLEQYYQCVFANLTSCLQAVNSTKARDLPQPASISTGIGNVCRNRHKLNESCIQDRAVDVETCFSTFIGESDKAGDQCATYEELIRCTEKQSVCPGGRVVQDFVVSARPNACTGDAPAVIMIPPASLRLLLLLPILLALSAAGLI